MNLRLLAALATAVTAASGCVAGGDTSETIDSADDRLTTDLQATAQTWTASSGDAAQASSNDVRLHVGGSAGGDTFSFTTSVAAGTYAIAVKYAKRNVYGDYRLDANGVTVGSLPGYSSSSSDVWTTVTFPAIALSGKVQFKFTLTGKNAASTGSDIKISDIELTASSSTSSSSSSTTSSSSGHSSSSSSSSSTTSSGHSSSSSSSTSSSGTSTSSSGGSTGTNGVGPTCGEDDPNLAGIEPQMPTVCQTITSSSTNIQSALNSCAGHGAVKLTGASSFSVGTLTLTAGAKLWIDQGVTLNLTGNASPGLISVTGANAGIYGEGTIDAKGAASGTTMIHSSGDKFVLYKVHLHNSQKMHVKVQGDGFVIWGNTLISGSSTANTDGIDPGAGVSGLDTTNGYIACNTISVGDDQIAVKGAQGKVTNLTIAHNYFGAGHGMSIGSETGPGGINGMKVYDLTVDGDYFPKASAVNANAIRIKSYNGAGGPVDNVSYENICARNLHNAILIETDYTQGTVTGGGEPNFGAASIEDFHLLRGSGSQTPVITITGTSTTRTVVTLDNVVVDGLTTAIKASDATVVVGPGGASPGVTGATQGTPHPIDCSSRFITFPTN